MRRLTLFLTSVLLCAPPAGAAEITPTDVWHLAKGIDQSIQRHFEVASAFDKDYLTYNAKPRNVFQRVVFLAEEYAQLHPDRIDAQDLAAARGKKAEEIEPKDVYGVLELIKADLSARGQYAPAAQEEGEKTPSDVYQMLRRISVLLVQIAERQGLPVWAVPARVYEANCVQVMPMLRAALADKGTPPPDFKFPKIAIKGIRPLDVFWVQRMIYNDIGAYYKKETGYEPIEFEDPRRLTISPGDVFDLTQIIIGELKILLGESKALDERSAARYARWQESKNHILPGDVYQLVRYNLRLAWLLVNK